MHNLKVIFEDNKIIVVEKPSGIPVQSDSSSDADLFSICKSYIKEKYNKPGNVFLGLVHRLDRPVGGVTVFAKNSKSAARLSELIRERKIKKVYLAILEGSLSKREGKLVNYLVKDTNANKVKVFNKEVKGSKYSELKYQTLEYNPKENLTLVEVTLITGRPHQIRAQFSNMKNPIWGDVKYESKSKSLDIALWAYKLEIAINNYPVFTAKPNIKNYPWSEFNRCLAG